MIQHGKENVEMIHNVIIMKQLKNIKLKKKIYVQIHIVKLANLRNINNIITIMIQNHTCVKQIIVKWTFHIIQINIQKIIMNVNKNVIQYYIHYMYHKKIVLKQDRH